MSAVIRTFLFLALFVGASFFCASRTQGFRYAQLLSHLPNRPEWEVSAPSKEVKERLHQSFTYLGAGEQSVAFLGEDGDTVLKFFKHGSPWKKSIKNLPLPSFVKQKISRMRLFRTFEPAALFESCVIAYEDLKEETGVLHLHLNKTEHSFGSVTLYDPLRVMHQIDLDATEFVLQEYAELVFARIDREMKEGAQEKAAISIQALLDSIETYSQKGIRVDQPAIQRNMGFREGKVILLDIGSFEKAEACRTKEGTCKELVEVTHRLERWIRRHHPALLPIFRERLYKKLGGVETTVSP